MFTYLQELLGTYGHDMVVFVSGMTFQSGFQWFFNKGADGVNERFWAWLRPPAPPGSTPVAKPTSNDPETEGLGGRIVGALLGVAGSMLLILTIGPIAMAASFLVVAIAFAFATFLVYVAFKILWFAYKMLTDPEFTWLPEDTESPVEPLRLVPPPLDVPESKIPAAVNPEDDPRPDNDNERPKAPS